MDQVVKSYEETTKSNMAYANLGKYTFKTTRKPQLRSRILGPPRVSV
jgi:hypothetical protein